MHCQGIACTRQFHMGLTSPEGQKLERFKRMTNAIYTHCENLVNPQSGNTKGGSITVRLTSCLTGLESAA
jgi:hypothetical protein